MLVLKLHLYKAQKTSNLKNISVHLSHLNKSTQLKKKKTIKCGFGTFQDFL